MVSLNIGLDFDGTVTAAPNIFKDFVAAMRAAGHKVYIVTMRYASEEGEINYWRRYVDDVIFTGRQAKAPAMEAKGIPIHIWIDDNPQAIHMSATQIWGTQTPEGVVHSPTHDKEQDAKDIAALLASSTAETQQ